jgi:beta-galactosidase
MPKSAQVEDADILKYKLGVNIVRTSHYPQSRHFLNRCDEIGLLVFEEIPGWQHIGEIKFKENSFLNLRNMIIKDRNHPSIILWGVRVNESPDDHEFYLETNKIAKSLDPTRQTGGVRNFANSEFLEDVYTYNDFSHTGLNKGIEKKSRITKKVPYLVTEYNGHMFPTKKYDQESKRVAHALRHLNVINEMMDKNNNISGAIGWVMNDYNTHKEFGSGDKVCYHGVLDMFRNFKYAGYAYSSQNSDDYVLEVLSDMNIGDYNAGHLDKVYVLTNLDYIKLYKNDRLIDTFYKDFKTFKHLKNPPIVVSDFIGNILMEDEKLSYKDAEMTKNILKAVTVYGNNLPLKYKLKILYLLKKYKMTYDEGVKMFFKYIGGWGSISPIYKFEGYLNDQLIKTVIKETNHSFDYILESNEKPLVIEETYDVRRYTLKKVNQHKELVNYSFDAFTVKTSGSIELIGKHILSLQGGEISFWIRTIHQGLGYIEIEINDQILIEEVLVS